MDRSKHHTGRENVTLYKSKGGGDGAMAPLTRNNDTR
jgi:hypothetical protein